MRSLWVVLSALLGACWVAPLREAPEATTPTRHLVLDEGNPPPKFVAYSPASPNDSRRTILIGESEAGSVVHVFKGEECSETSPAQALAGTDGRFQLAVEGDANSTTAFAAFAEFGDGTTSACVGMSAYTHDDLPPVLDASAPAVGRDPAPIVTISSEPGVRVSLYSAPDCQGSSSASEVIGAGGSATLTGAAVLEHTTPLSIRALDNAGNSACVNLSYVHDSGPPAVVATIVADAASPDTELRFEVTALDPAKVAGGAGSGVVEVEACVSLDPLGCASGFAATHSEKTSDENALIEASGLLPDTHYYGRVRARDAAGNASETGLLGLRTAGDRGVRAIAVGDLYICALMANGRVNCLGQNTSAQVGLPPAAGYVTTPNLIRLEDGTPLERAVDIAAGPEHACALTSDGNVYCWGGNNEGQLGDRYISATGAPRPWAAQANHINNPPVLAIAVGDASSCFLHVDGRVRCFGAASLGQVGRGGACDNTSSTPCLSPQLLTSSGAAPVSTMVGPDLDAVIQIVGNREHYCALRSSGDVWCWGRNDKAQLGIGDTNTRAKANPVAGFGAAVALTTTRFNTCALGADGAVRCSGDNAGSGILGVSPATLPLATTPALLPGLSATELRGGNHFLCARQIDGELRCLGQNVGGALGNPSFPVGVGAVTPQTVMASGVAQRAGRIACGRYACCALEGGRTSCWGESPFDGSAVTSAQPITWPKTPSGVERVAAGAAHACALLTSGELQCWGDSTLGQAGIVGPAPVLFPRSITSSRRYREVVAGTNHTCALGDDGFVDCFGDSTYGQAGVSASIASALQQTERARAIAAGARHTCLLGATGVVRCFGDNGSGQLGRVSATTHVPGDMAGSAGTRALGLGSDHSCILLATGGVSCAGKNTSGQLGDNGGPGGTTLVSALDEASGLALAAIAELLVGGARSCARRPNGGLACWGENAGGGLAVGSGAATVLRARTVTGATETRICAGGARHTCGFPSGCFGANDFGAIGLGASAVATAPVGLALPLAFGPRGVALGTDTTFVTGAGGRLVVLGRNDRGQLGLGEAIAELAEPTELAHVP
ncbi:MAG: hypothetical protein IT381_23285 [Deltaproteobacteria bacterium]|nr:hypothetical protein [Deltaproteobacteria bacterium]